MPACHKVHDMLDTVSKKRGIRAIAPSFRERRDEIKDLADSWMMNDDKVFKGLENLHNSLLSEMRYIYFNLEEETLKAQNEFNSFINQTMVDLEAIQEQIRVLESIKRSV